MTKPDIDLYEKYFQARHFERLDLFQILADKFDVKRVLYAGSFVHITPSFVFPDVVYVDQDKQAQQFFEKPEIIELITQKKKYSQKAKITFHFADYRNGFDELLNSFDLLISQYAGFVGQHCKQYLKEGGILLANNSHGDAGMASIDEDYQLKAVFSVINGRYRIIETNLDEYFIPKSQIQISRDHLEKLKIGISYKKSAAEYLFQKIY